MPPHLKRASWPLLLAPLALLTPACAERGARPAASGAARPAPAAHARSLGNLRTASPVTPAQAQLAEFLFGAPPEPPIGLQRPVALCAREEGLLVGDVGLGAVVALRTAAPHMQAAADAGAARAPIALSLAPDGGVLVADAATQRVELLDAGGRRVRLFALDDAPLRPAGVTVAEGQVWVSNAARQRIEVFDLRGGSHLRTVGSRGDQPGQFAMPLALATTPSGDVLVADLLAARVHRFAPAGAFLGSLGAPTRGYVGLSRPKGVAVGPDGVIFVSDVGTRSVHAFRPDGAPLTVFGAVADGSDELALPAGVAIAPGPIAAERAVPDGFRADYFVLVAESLLRPGIRVYAWRSRLPDSPPSPTAPALRSHSDNPHWRADGCLACHTGASPQAISVAAATTLCVACHDGTRAHAEAHPIGWPAAGLRTRAPRDWPLDDGRIACLTCHDIRRHCDTTAVRPAANPALVRGHDPADALASCAACHLPEPQRENPHRTTDACRWCHQPVPQAADGRRRGDPQLRAQPTQLCLNCHTMHADPAPGGHLGRFLSDARQATLERRGQAHRLPLADGRIHCATCHTPHPPGCFPHDSALGARARGPGSEHDLRVDLVTLCTACHPE